MPVPPVQPAERTLTGPRRRALAAGLALAAVAACGAAALLAIRPPAAVGPDAPADDFSAGRAVEHVRRVAGGGPHVAGSAANDRVREHLVATLRGLGLAVEVQDTVSPEGGTLSASAGGIGLARVRNVVARLPGAASTGRLFLVAHYDSIQIGPGGSDDGAGTAAVLELARALTAGDRPRNDIVFLLTDAEEACLCGAAAFATGHPLATGGGVVLNLEARGSTGPAIMFETSRRNAGLIAAYARTPRPVGTSFAVEIYRRLPNDTDFTPFLAAGFAGLNTAYIDGSAVYHTPLDTAAAMNVDSLQHHGDNALALARHLGAVDLASVSADADATYFPVPWGLARYPGGLTWPLAIAGLLGVAALGWLVHRQGRASVLRLLGGFLVAGLPVLAAPVVAQLFWAGLTTVRPGYAELLDPYRPLWFRLAVLAWAATVLFAWYALVRRRFGPAAVAVGGLGWLAAFGVLLAAAAPGGSYLGALPALAGAAGGITALLADRRGPALLADRRGPAPLGGRGTGAGRWVVPGAVRRWAAVAAVTAAAAIATVIWLPTVVLLFPALGLAMGGVAALCAVLLGLAVLPVLDLLHPVPGGQRGMSALRARRAGLAPTALALLAAVTLTAAGLSGDRFDAEHPVPTQLMYALDADTGQARWLSAEESAQPWTAGFVSQTTTVADELPALGDGTLLSGPAAPPANLPAPALDTLADTRSGDVRSLRLRLRPQRPVRLVALHVGADTPVTRAVVAGRDVPVDRPSGGRWGFGFVFHAPPGDGVEVALEVRAAGPVRLRAMDGSDGLAGLPGFRPRPPGVGIAGSHSSELVAVARTYTV